MSVGFFLVGGACGLLVGYATDSPSIRQKLSRTKLFAAVVVLGETGCIGTYMCSTYRQLLLCRVITGIAVGGASPIIYSILGDLWGATSRVLVATLVGLSMSFGAAFGQVLAAYLAPQFGWRAPFLAVAGPAVGCAVLLMLATEPPALRTALTAVGGTPEGQYMGAQAEEGLSPGGSSSDSLSGSGSSSGSSSGFGFEVVTLTGSADSAAAEWSQSPVKQRTSVAIGTGAGAASPTKLRLLQPASTSADSDSDMQAQGSEAIPSLQDRLREVFRANTACLVFLQGIFGCVPWAILGVYFNDFLQHDLRLSVHTSTMLMTTFGVGAACGQIGGGALGQKLFNADPRKQSVLMGITTTLGTVPLLLIINNPTFLTPQGAGVVSAEHSGSGAAGRVAALRDGSEPDSPFSQVHGVSGSAYAGPETYIFLLFFAAGLLAAVTGPNVRSVLQNITDPHNRGLAFALFALCDDVGKGAGPYAVARLIAWTGSRKAAFDIGILSWLVSGSLCLCMYLTVRWDVNKCKERSNKREGRD